MKKKTLWIIIGVLCAAAILYLAVRPTGKSSVTLETAKAERINITNSVTATGTVEPVTKVEVGTQVSGIIDKLYADYNDEVKAAGHEERAITYTDYVGLLMTSVTDIVNMISLVLIAFVSISLVVSSIMIGIITYISVLERKKEIGILRAIGASKGNVASVFNAETFIEGLIAGVFAIAVVVLVSIPVNDAVLKGYNVENIMSLPATAGAALIAVSVVLTVVAGLLPAHGASKKDPVEALRSE